TKDIEDIPPVSRIRETRNSLFGENTEPNEIKKEGTFDLGSGRQTRNMGFDMGLSSRRETPIETPKPKIEEKPKKEQPPINRVYHKPPLDLLKSYTMQVDERSEDHETKMEIIKRTLEEFHINADVVGYVQGPTITRYEIKMLPGVSVKRVVSIDDDLQMRLATKCGIRIEAPIPGKDLVGIEVANNVKVTVGLRELLEQASSKPTKPGALTFALGKDLVGNAITDNLAKGPHYLVAGATGSGKSVSLNVMIVSMLMKYSPEELRLILVDPKTVEFGIYEHLPHLMIDEIITDPQKTLHVLQWAYVEMEKRFAMFKECGERIVDVESYNERIASSTVPKMPRIVIIIDELADLMESCKKDMESKIRALAQKSRAVGIHLVLATQRPSVDIITGTIKANLPSRIALKVMNSADSMTILGEGGAEKLLGNGDMLYKNSSMGEYERYQGAWISDEEITNIVDYIKENNKAYFDDDLSEYLENAIHPKVEEHEESDEEGGESPKDADDKDLFIKSVALAISVGTMSISLLQRRFRVGYAKAGWLVDQMEVKGFISGNEGSKARKVLITREEFEAKYGRPPEEYNG
ncbi:MAG: DNA translocase FtsK, partial [Firmicutes bacterium]|nr:DNA translocase FtsK [Candidatus Caballimonas caccae]